MGFYREEYWSGLPCPPPGDLPDPGIKPMSLKSPALAGRFFTISATWEAHVHLLLLFISLISQTLFMRLFSLRVIYRNKILLSVVIDKSQLFSIVRGTEKRKWRWSRSVVSDSLWSRGLNVAHQAPPSIGFSRQEYWSGLPFPSPEDLPNPGIEPGSPALQEDALTSEPPGKPGTEKALDKYLLKEGRDGWVNFSWDWNYIFKHWITSAAAAATSLQLCPTLCDPTDSSPPGFPSLGFSRQEHWSGLPCPSLMRESEKWKRSRSVMSDSSDPMDCSPPGSSVHGIFQARVLEWGAIAFSGITSPSYKNTIGVSGDTTLVLMISKASKATIYKV